MTLKTIKSEVDSMIENSNNALTKVDNTLDNFNTTLLTANHTIDTVSSAIVQVKELEYSIKALDTQVDLICAEFDMKIEKCKMQSLVVQNALMMLSSKSDKILDIILAMENNSDDQNYINHRSELISLLKHNTEGISNMFLKFLSI